MEKSGMSPKTLQYIMGHADISVTLNTYTHLKFDDAKVEFDRVMEAWKSTQKSLSAIGSMPGSKHIPCTTQFTTFA